MSRIDKLSISGVRSFSPAVREAIQFNTPLTLIVGYNGSGKTTLIECLKYATTGELPPNSKGGAFIHDPKLCGEKEVLAQVKLQFRSINDRQHVATRSVQLSVKKTTRAQKTLDCSLVVINNGERTTTSTRQAQLDEMIPERLGVSPAILDAVIFCHQDESLWPLSEPAALKKRFDEIFEALKYTRAIDNIKVLRKKQVEQLTTLQNDEAHHKANKERGERAEKRMTGLQEEIESAREQCESLTSEMEETQEKVREKHEHANSFLQIVQNLDNKKDQLRYKGEAVRELKEAIVDELDEDDATLEQSLAQYQQRLKVYEKEAKEKTKLFQDMQKDVDQMRRDLNVKLSEKGRHESDKEKYERQLKARVEAIQEAANKFGFRGFDDHISEQQIQSFDEKIRKLLSDRKRDLERLQKENATELDQATSVITEKEGRKAATIQDRLSARQRIATIESRTQVLQNEAGRLDVDEGAVTILDRQLQDLESRSSQSQREYEAADWDKQITEENDKLWIQESDGEKLGRELVECTRLASERAQLDFRKKEMADRKRKLETLLETWKPKLSKLLGSDDWAPENLDDSFQAVMSTQAKNLDETRRRRDQAKQKQQKVEFKLKNVKDSRDKKSQEVSRCKTKVVEALRDVRDNAVIEDYEDEVASVEQQADELRNEVSLFDALVDYYTKCKRMLDSKRRCLLCERHFDDAQSASLERISKKIEKNLDPKGKIEVEKDLAQAAASLEKLRMVRSDHDLYQRLISELPALQEECKEVQSEFDSLERQLEEQDSLVNDEQERHRDLEEASKGVHNITQTVKEIKESESQVDRIMSQQASSNAARSVDEIHELQANVAEQIKVLKSRVSKLTTEKQRMRDQINSLELEKSELRTKISRASGQLDKKKDLQGQIQSLKEEVTHQRSVIQKADEELESIEPSIVEARAVRDDTLQRGRSKEQGIANARDEISSSIQEIKVIESDIQAYVDGGGASNIASNQRAIDDLEKSIETTDQEVKDLTAQTNKLNQEIDNGDRQKKNISDNLNYRRHSTAIEMLRREIADLEDRNAHEDYERLHEEARMLENHANRLVAERGSVMGTMKTKDEELDRLLREWEMDYKDAYSKHRESHIRVETTRAAIEDLAQCGSALDKAVMQFHSLKMAEVNRIAGELWQSTYQGTDIDTILIRSDNEANTGKRNYNYRLCMVKQDAEMDMRGRCSAGQKVLASIIIRLALAESFGVNCGLIALDEPTTNLDRDNIKSLAESLHSIIKARQAQSNFQLIVITHDEEFLRHMRCSDFCDSFFRVKRDDRQNSIISRESITKIF